jgi:hypothetical protein
MIINKSIVSIILTSCFAQIIYCQDLHIYYDIESEHIEYKYDDENIKKPKVRIGDQVFLHINNYNNYLYTVEVKANEREIYIPISSGSNPLASMLSGKGGSMPSLNLLSSSGTLGQDPLNLLTESLKMDDEDQMGFAQSASTNSSMASLQMQFNSALSAIQMAESELVIAGKEIGEELEARQVYDMVARELEKLKHNPNLKTDQIKKLANEYLQKVFNVDDIKEIDLSYVLERSDMEQVMKKHLSNLNSKKQLYKNQIEKLDVINLKLGLLGVKDNSSSELTSKIRDTHLKSKEILKLVENDEVTVQELLNSNRENDVSYLADLRYEYEAIMSNDFSHTFRTMASGDYVSFEILLKEKIPGEGVSSIIHKAPIEVPVSGNFKINASLGLSFGAFGKAVEDYYIRDSQIFADEKNEVIPMITSFVHFYSQSVGNTSVGGSIGIGIPITGGGNISSLSFLLGPSLVIGKSSRVVISGGLMVGQVERLAQGFEIGDGFISQADLVPTKEQYELGYYLGLSYNIGSR